MIDIVQASPGSHHLAELHNRFVAEWGAFDAHDAHDAFDAARFGATPPPPPPPLLALRGPWLPGGLAFSRYPSPLANVVGLGINGLQDEMTHRRQGITSLLIRAAERQAQALGVAVMFVRTQLPGLYQALGWQLVETRDGLAILGRNLAREAAAPLGAAPLNAAPFSAPPACRPT